MNPTVNLSVVDITNTILSISEFRNLFNGVFSDVDVYPDTEIRNAIWLAAMEVSKCAMGGYYKLATYFLAAHFIIIFKQAVTGEKQQPGGGLGAEATSVATSVHTGDLSLTRKFPNYTNVDDAYLSTTWYGQQFIHYRNKMSHGPLLARRLVLRNDCPSVSNPKIVIVD